MWPKNMQYAVRGSIGFESLTHKYVRLLRSASSEGMVPVSRFVPSPLHAVSNATIVPWFILSSFLEWGTQHDQKDKCHDGKYKMRVIGRNDIDGSHNSQIAKRINEINTFDKKA